MLALDRLRGSISQKEKIKSKMSSLQSQKKYQIHRQLDNSFSSHFLRFVYVLALSRTKLKDLWHAVGPSIFRKSILWSISCRLEKSKLLWKTINLLKDSQCSNILAPNFCLMKMKISSLKPRRKK